MIYLSYSHSETNESFKLEIAASNNILLEPFIL